MKQINKIKMHIDFNKIYYDIVETPDIKKKILLCPFCHQYKLSVNPDDYSFSQCFNNQCQWYGDFIQLYQDIKELSFIDAIQQIIDGYNLENENIDIEILSNECNERLKRFADRLFIRHFRMMMSGLNLSNKDISKLLGINPKYISLILNEKLYHYDLQGKMYHIALNKMVKFYNKRYDEWANHIDLHFKEETLNTIQNSNYQIKRIYGL